MAADATFASEDPIYVDGIDGNWEAGGWGNGLEAYDIASTASTTASGTGTLTFVGCACVCVSSCLFARQARCSNNHNLAFHFPCIGRRVAARIDNYGCFYVHADWSAPGQVRMRRVLSSRVRLWDQGPFLSLRHPLPLPSTPPSLAPTLPHSHLLKTNASPKPLRLPRGQVRSVGPELDLFQFWIKRADATKPEPRLYLEALGASDVSFSGGDRLPLLPEHITGPSRRLPKRPVLCVAVVGLWDLAR